MSQVADNQPKFQQNSDSRPPRFSSKASRFPHPPSDEPIKATSARLFVGNLQFSIRNDRLKEHMQSAGTIINCQVLFEPSSRSKGCGIVEYSSVEEAQVAIDTLNESVLEGRRVFIREDREPELAIPTNSFPEGEASGEPGSHPYSGRKVFVTNLPFNARWQELKDFFKECGQILHADVLTLPGGAPRGQGSVLFATKESAESAIKLSGNDLGGRAINVREYNF